MLTLSQAAQLEKEKLNGESAWIVLLEIQVAGLDTIYICRNTENITWDSKEWIAFAFELEDIKEDSKGEIPNLTLRVSNVSLALQSYIEQGNGGVGAKVIFRVVLSKHLDAAEAELEEEFICNSTSIAEQWVTFNLGCGDPRMKRIPSRRYIKNFCPFKYKGIECASTSLETLCNKTLSNCRERNNSIRFGGFQSIPQGGIYK